MANYKWPWMLKISQGQKLLCVEGLTQTFKIVRVGLVL